MRPEKTELREMANLRNLKLLLNQWLKLGLVWFVLFNDT